MKRIRPLLVLLVSLALACMGGTLAFADNENSARTAQGTAIADGNTASTWRDWGLENSTENVGRIWTDKTVQAGDITLTGAGGTKAISKGDSTFLTALSAISSTSNLKSTATTPLDIVLVLDASGSMSDPMGNGDATKRIDALKSAANSFVDEIAKQNASVSDTAKQHQVSIVKFAGDESYRVGNDMYRDGQFTYNYSQVMKVMSACTNDSKGSFQSTINGITPAGATRADNGMELAQGQTSGRSDAKKIVIFFTDGTPTSFSSFDNGVASSAVSSAKAIKDAKGSVYTIGIFSGADPAANVNSASNENKFMQAVSSNYPGATYAQSNRGGYSWDFGTRAADSDFYKSATNADELKKVFESISQEIVKGSGYPTDTTEGFEADSGFITFTDQLGDYMKVDGFTSIVFANQVFENPTKTTDGLVDTYTFTGEAGNALYPKGNLRDIDITVTRSNDLKTGDKVEVKIPAALIPLRNFQINEDGTGSVDLTFPIRAFYGSSLKAGVVDALANPDPALTAYIASNSADGKVNFLANKWNGGNDGDVVANFTPSKGNSYYYITEDTPIYQDEACTQRANAPLEQGKTYYYQRTWYDISNGKATQQTKTVSFDSSVVENINGYISSDNGKAYFKAGTPRMTYINELNTAKSENITQTAGTFINPKWAGGQVNVLLGNNGKLSVDQPGTLAISKTVEVPEGYDASEYANDSFEFTIAIPKAANTTLKAQVKNAADENVGDAFDIAFDENGNAKHSLKTGETLYVYGLAAGTEYTVTETPKAGFTQTAPVDESGAATAAVGTIEAAKTSDADFTNKYSATGTLNGETALAGEKVLTGRDWLSSDKFTFLLKDANTSVEAPMPEGSSQGTTRIEVTQSEGTPADTPVPFHFGDITYTQPGVYIYEIWESEELSTINPGISASQALYRVTVKVTDESHNGQLSIESVMEKLAGDGGKALDQPEKVEWNGNVPPVARFTNSFNNDYVDWTPSGTKTYTDSTGANQMVSGMFHVVAATQQADAPMPGSQVITDIEGWRYVVTSISDSGSIVFDPAQFSLTDKGKEFKYIIAEAIQTDGKWASVRQTIDPDTDGNYILNGMKYDATSWDATVKVGSTEVDGKDTVTLEVTYKNRITGEVATAPQFAFANSYNPDSAKATIDGTKTLTGRDMFEGETFGFTLSAADKVTQDAVTAGTVTIPTSTATVSGATNGEAKGFNFSDVTFTKPGTYKFNVSETQWDGNVLPSDGMDGLTFDRGTKTVTVVVTDGHDGSLKAELAYPEGGVAFTNQYDSSVTFAGIQVSKALVGRNMQAGEFGFTIEGADDASKALLTDTDMSFTNENPRVAGEEDVMTKLAGHVFTLKDAGTYTFTVSEKQGNLGGVTYDEATHRVEIVVSDNGDGTMRIATKVDGVEGTKVSFRNAYEAESVGFDTANAQLKKVLEGRDWLDSDSFTFNLKAIDGAPMPEGTVDGVATATVTKANAASFGFGNITYTTDMLQGTPSRTFVYEVSEVAGNIEGIDYAPNKATVTVTVADNGEGKLTASASTVNGTFVNRYTASVSYTANGGIQLAKTLNGRDMTDGQFKIAVTPGNAESANALGLAEGSNEFAMPAGADGAQVLKQILSGDVVFTQNDAGKTYTYTVSEPGSAAGYTYDTTTYTVAIAVTISDTGKLAVTTTVTGGESAGTYVYTSDSTELNPVTLAFTNSYKAEGSVAIAGTKTLTGRSLTDGEFSFAVKLLSGDGDLATASNDGDGRIDFGSLSYTTSGLADMVAKRQATKSVKSGNPTWTISYVAYEKTDKLPADVSAKNQSIPFQVKVTDLGNGKLNAEVVADGGITFRNVYGAAEADLVGAKELSASTGLVPEGLDITGKYTFTVKSDTSGAPMPEHSTATNGKDGKIDFGSIKFTAKDLDNVLGEKVDTRQVMQKAAAKQDSAKAGNQAVTSKAEKAAGTVAAEAESDASATAGEEPKAANEDASTSKAAGEASAQEAAAGKAVALEVPDAGAAVQDVDSSKTVKTESAAPVDSEPTAEQTASASEDAKAAASLPRSYTFTYTITESGLVPNITNDGAKKVSFTVTENENGTITVKRSGTEGALAFLFNNKYQTPPVTSSVTDSITVTKNLTGRTLKAGEFQFNLLDKGNNIVATAENAANGSVMFGGLEYKAPGTYHYTIVETNGGSFANGISYDGATYGVTTTVAAEKDGTLSVTHKLDNGGTEATFNNSYQGVQTSVVLGATKVLTGKNLSADEFTFALAADDGTQVTAKNDADGSVSFPAKEFTETGTYHYILSEVKGNEAGVTYDESTYPVTVTVKDDGAGNLVATVSYDKGEAPVFRNSYKEPESPISFIFNNTNNTTVNNGSHSTTVKTGDSALPLAAVIAAAAALAAGIAVAARRKGRR